jgi:hypothetical protein
LEAALAGPPGCSLGTTRLPKFWSIDKALWFANVGNQALEFRPAAQRIKVGFP